MTFISIQREIEKLEALEAAATAKASPEKIQAILLANPPEGMEHERWRDFAVDAAKNHGALIVAGLALVGGNTDLFIDSATKALDMINTLTPQEYEIFCLHCAKAVSFAGFAIEKFLHISVGLKSAIDDVRKRITNKPVESAWFNYIKRDYSVNMGPLMVSNHSLQVLLNALDAFADPSRAGPAITKSFSRIISSAAITGSLANDVEKRLARGEDLDSTFLKKSAVWISDKISGSPLDYLRKNHSQALKYAMASPFVVFLVQDMMNKNYDHALIPFSSVVGYLALGISMEQNKGNAKQ